MKPLNGRCNANWLNLGQFLSFGGLLPCSQAPPRFLEHCNNVIFLHGKAAVHFLLASGIYEVFNFPLLLVGLDGHATIVTYEFALSRCGRVI